MGSGSGSRTGSGSGGRTGFESGALARLIRWETAGGTWRVGSRGPDSASVILCRCDGGEELERIVSSEPGLLEFLDRTPAPVDD
jgi:hypothetical protein